MINKSKSHHDKKKMVAIEMVDGLILEGKEKEFYVGYAYGNNHRKQFPWNEPRKKSQLLGDLVHTKLVWSNATNQRRWSSLFCLVEK
jgi:hypothetical protein